jgi:hypothetical protein
MSFSENRFPLFRDMRGRLRNLDGFVLQAVVPPLSGCRRTCIIHRYICIPARATLRNLHGYIQRYGTMMMELALALAVGFALGYGVREWVSRQRRRAFGRQRR